MKLKLFDRNSDVLKDMAKSSYVYIYGAGDFGRDIYIFLKERGVQVRAYTVDDQYYDESRQDMSTFQDCLMQIKQHDGYLIWGIAKPSALRDVLKRDDISEVYLTYDTPQMWQDRAFAHKHEAAFATTRELFADEYSRKTFDAYLKIYEGDPTDDIKLAEDGTYFNDLTDDIHEGGMVDCGAYTGDSIQSFVNAYGKGRKIFAFEPDAKNYSKLLANTAGLDVVAVPAGVWSAQTTLRFSSGNDAASGIQEEGAIEIKTDTIDHVVGDHKIAFIKMDVEGSELEALKGAAHVIQRDMPVLAISAYHKQEDLITLPQFIAGCKNENFKYDIFLRHHGCTVPELVLYGIPRKR